MFVFKNIVVSKYFADLFLFWLKLGADSTGETGASLVFARCLFSCLSFWSCRRHSLHSPNVTSCQLKSCGVWVWLRTFLARPTHTFDALAPTRTRGHGYGQPSTRYKPQNAIFPNPSPDTHTRESSRISIMSAMKMRSIFVRSRGCVKQCDVSVANNREKDVMLRACVCEFMFLWISKKKTTWPKKSGHWVSGWVAECGRLMARSNQKISWARIKAVYKYFYTDTTMYVSVQMRF